MYNGYKINLKNHELYIQYLLYLNTFLENQLIKYYPQILNKDYLLFLVVQI